jgi:mannitol-1-phosphate 5-dehydrogenase
MAQKIVLFGAGATGRGHVGLLAWQAGFEMVFVDIKPPLVESLRRAGKYRVVMHSLPGKDGSPAAGPREIVVDGFRTHDAKDRQAIAREITDAALVLTAVFDQNLPDVARTLALAVGACRAAGRDTPLNCIACENMMDSSSTLGKHVKALLDAEDAAYAERRFAFPDCMISRVVPRPEPDPLVIVTEDYNEWTARAEAFKGDKPAALTALELVANQTARLERKLMIHNGGHAVCGYFAFHRGLDFIHEAVADPVVLEHVVGALNEIGEVVRRKHGFSAASIDEYKQDLGRRGSIAAMRDQVLRVVRDPVRKLSPRERLVAPAMLAADYGLPFKWIASGIVAALKYAHPADEQAAALQAMLRRDGLDAVLQSVCQIQRGSALHAAIRRAWDAWPPF